MLRRDSFPKDEELTRTFSVCLQTSNALQESERQKITYQIKAKVKQGPRYDATIANEWRLRR